MSPKQCAIAVDEVKVQTHHKVIEDHFEPDLKVLVNKRYVMNPDSKTDGKPVSIRGRMTISF